MTYTTVLFDLDGTILDTNDLIISSMLHALKQFFPEGQHTREEIIPHMGKTLNDIMAHYAPDKVDELTKVYREYNLSKHDELVQAFPHVKEVLEELKHLGVKMGIVTTKQRLTTEMGLKLCQIDSYFDTVVTLQDVTQPKPHPEPVLKAMSDLGALAPKTLMVGDSRFDIEAAQRAGVDSAGVAWSLKGEKYLQSFSPTYMLHSIKDLLPIVQRT
ncbi:pyrophosphatase PpaX [Bacillus horti]|uniref:Pyrophosphatase PpaX n=1 Tax=Caldalkalibacillus horti TaxID=77523 RepID=A0ABT9W5A1_9BACI|nr:pyrophosphatase PpaX [Bacillus horti]MDQ0168429.1 pyrophosphatase PpaX [Bacillus horti]